MITELHKYRDQLIRDEISNYNLEYKASKWYKEPTIRKIIGDYLYDDYIALEKALETADKEKITKLIKLFEQAAHSYGKAWWDEDLDCYRSGSEFETEFYVTLRNIAAKVVGIPARDMVEFYEDKGF